MSACALRTSHTYLPIVFFRSGRRDFPSCRYQRPSLPLPHEYFGLSLLILNGTKCWH